MKTNYLFPAVFRKIGWILLVPFGALSVCSLLTGLNNWNFSSSETSGCFIEKLVTAGETGYLDEISVIGLVMTLLFVSFSREKDEDEYIAKLRMDSLVWAILVNYLLLILTTLFVYGGAYLYVAFVSMFTVLILFIGKYNWVLYQFRKTGTGNE